MKKNNQIPIALYAVVDIVTAALAWALFYFVRKWLVKEEIFVGGHLQVDYKFWLGVSLIPLGWLILYTLVGAYNSLYKKSRLFEFTYTLICSLIGCIVIFLFYCLTIQRVTILITISPSYLYLESISLLHFLVDSFFSTLQKNS